MAVLAVLAVLALSAQWVRTADASAPNWTLQKVEAGDEERSAEFGFDAAMSQDGTTMVVGAPQENSVGANAGAAYVFTRASAAGNYTQTAKLQASRGTRRVRR